MYSAAPRCSDWRSPRSTPDCMRSPPLDAKAETDTSRPAAMPARVRTKLLLIMHRHPFRHRLGLVELGPNRHGQEEEEIQDGQHAADLGLHGVGTRAGADL